MTKRQLEALNFIKRFIRVRGYAPSYDEIRLAMGAVSKSHVHRIVRALEALGQIRRLPNKARAIEIVEDPKIMSLSAFSTPDLAKEAKRRGLVLGHVLLDVQHLPNGETKRTQEFHEVRSD